MQQLDFQKDTTAWIFQTWASFIIAIGTAGVGIAYLPVDAWVKGYMSMSYAFTVGSSFTLAKTLRDNQEATRIISRIDEARVEKILAERHPLK